MTEGRVDVETARARLIEAEQEYQRARIDDYVTRLVRGSAIVDAHRAGLSSNEISRLLGNMGQPNVVRARRRALARSEVVPGDLLRLMPSGNRVSRLASSFKRSGTVA